jgi:hypothetical protein
VSTLLRALVLTSALCALPLGVHAQRADGAALGVRVEQPAAQSSPNSGPWNTDTVTSKFGGSFGRLPVWSAPIASALVPGLGQARLGQDRFVAYLALETYLLIEYFKNEREGNHNADSFRAIARDIARRGFPGSRPDTVWQYYEKVEKYDASGVFSKSLTGPIVPETDTLTYNGQQWILARKVHGIPLDQNPANNVRYADAVAYYASRAITQPYGWSWVNASFEKDIFKQTIGKSNDAYRRATGDLIALMANHIVSSIDAFSSVRLIQSRAGVLHVQASIPVR